MTRRGRKALALLSCAALLAAGGAAVWLAFLRWEGKQAEKTEPGRAVHPGTRRMAERLQALADAWDREPFHELEERTFRENRPRWIPEIRRRRDSADRLGDVLKWNHLLAFELLAAGRTREAIAEYERVYALLERAPVREEAKRGLRKRLRRDVATAYLRLGEEENCLARHGPDSCLFPLEGGAVHTRPQGARTALAILLEALAEDPEDLGARWLANIAAMAAGIYPSGLPQAYIIPRSAFASEAELPRFRDIAGRLGADAVGLAGGCAVDDFDGDGDLDIFASSWGLRDQLRFFRRGDDGSYSDATREAGLEGLTGGINLVHADYDNDGLLDLLVLRGGWLEPGRFPNSLLRNLGGGRFEDVTEQAGLLELEPSHTACWGDFDNDGWLDLFLGGEQNKPGTNPSRLYRNLGDGTFRDCAPASGLADLGFVKGSAWGDYDGDGWIDLYVSRAGQPNLLFRNLGRPKEGGAAWAWGFEDVTARAGVAEPVYSFPCWFFDYDNDGREDLFVAGFDGCSIDAVAGDSLGHPHRRGHPRLYRNRGDGTFEDVTRAARLDRVLLVMGANFGDIDNDGWLDLYLGTGAPNLATLMPNRMFRNDGGRTFQDVTTAGGFGHLQKGHGIAFADLDGDGDQDIYAVMGGWYTADVFPNVLFENPIGGRFIKLRLEGRKANRSAIGARVHVIARTAAGARSLWRTVGTGGSFGSQTLTVEVGLGDAEAVERIEVYWPGRKDPQVIAGAEIGSLLHIREES